MSESAWRRTSSVRDELQTARAGGQIPQRVLSATADIGPGPVAEKFWSAAAASEGTIGQRDG